MILKKIFIILILFGYTFLSAQTPPYDIEAADNLNSFLIATSPGENEFKYDHSELEVRNDSLCVVGKTCILNLNTLFYIESEIIANKSTNIIKTGSPSADFLFGSNTIKIDEISPSNNSDYINFFYFNKYRSHFTAGKHNNLIGELGDNVPQWDYNKLAQYSATFGYDQFVYGGYNDPIGNLGKGQFSAGYSNRGLNFAAQTLGFQNVNGSQEGFMTGSENIVSSIKYKCTFDTTTLKFKIANQDASSVFLTGRYMGCRTYHSGNGYHISSTGTIVTSTFDGTDTYIEGDHDTWFGKNFLIDTAYIFVAEPTTSLKSINVIGFQNEIEGANSRRSTYIGNNHRSSSIEDAFSIGSYTNNEISGSILYGNDYLDDIGDSQTYKLYSTLKEVGSLGVFRYYINNNALIDIPDNVYWRGTVVGVILKKDTDTLINVDGEFLLKKNTGGAIMISNSITNNGGLTINAALYSSGEKLAIEFTSTSGNFKGTLEVSINQIK